MKQNTCAPARTYGATLAHSLIYFAHKHIQFDNWLGGLLELHHISTNNQGYGNTVAEPGLVLHDMETATRRALWLMDALAEKRVEGHEEANEILASWARAHDQNEKSFIILGLKYGILNYGVIGHPKNRFEPMDVLIRKDVAQGGFNMSHVRTLTTLTHKIVEIGLIAAGGSTGKLEPELGDWLFGDKSLVLYSASQELLTNIETYAKDLSAPHATNKDAAGTTFLALTPALYLLDIPGSDQLTPLEDTAQ